MRALVGLWDVLNGNNDTKVSEIIDLVVTGDESHWDVVIAFKQAPEIKRFFAFNERTWPGFSDLLETGGDRQLAKMCLVELVNDSLWGSCSPMLNMDEDDGRIELLLTPNNLLAALWLMFAQEILGEKNLQRCLSCGRYFEVCNEENGRRQRSDKKYCGPKCRATAFRERIVRRKDAEAE
jgi:hypothetical protein